MTDEAQRHAVEKPDHAGVFEEGAEQDEKKNVRRRDQRRDAVDAFGAEAQLVHQLRYGIAAMGEVPGQVLAEQSVEQERAANDGQRHAEDAPCRLEHQQDHDGADEEIGHGRVARALDQLTLVDPVVEGEAETGERQYPVVPGNAGLRLGALHRRVEQEGDQEQEADVKGARYYAGERRETSHHQLVSGERDGRPGHRP